MSRQQLENDVWHACDIMRRDNNCGGVMEYVEHLAWLLFIKFLDDQENVFVEEAVYEGRPYHRLIDDKYRWSEWVPKALGRPLNENGTGTVKRGSPEWDGEELMQFVRGELIPYLAALSGSPEREIISGIFSDRNVIVCASPFNLKDVISIVDEIDFHNPDDVHTVSVVYESLLRRLGNVNKMAGEFYTPRAVIRFMVQVIDPQIGETVYDPASGSCGFLAQAYEYMRQQENDTQAEETLQRRTFYGHEKKPVPALLGLINMVLHGVSVPSVFRRNTLEEDIRHPGQRFDIVLTNPPFGGTENEQIQQNFPVKSNATELLFLEHIMKKLKATDGARCAVVVPEGTLFRGGAFATVKEDLLQTFDLSMVVSLPPGAFAPYSDVKTALLFFTRPGPTKEVLYYELRLPPGVKKFSKGTPIADEHFDEARQLWRQWQTYRQTRINRPEPTAYSWFETMETLVARTYDLSAKNPCLKEIEARHTPDELIANLLESSRNLTTRLERLQAILQSKEAIR